MSSLRMAWLLAAAAAVSWAAPSGAQTTLSPIERTLLLRIGTQRLTHRDFVRNLYALDALGSASRFRQQQSYRQFSSSQRALAERQRIQGLLAPRRMTPYPYARSAAPGVVDPRAVAAEQLRSDVMLVWERFGVTFLPEAVVGDAIMKVAPQYTAGLRVAGMLVDGPAEKAGWKRGDILIGLLRYQTKSYADVAYVAELENLAAVSPMQSILIRDGKVVRTTIAAALESSLDAEFLRELEAAKEEEAKAKGAAPAPPAGVPPRRPAADSKTPASEPPARAPQSVTTPAPGSAEKRVLKASPALEDAGPPAATAQPASTASPSPRLPPATTPPSAGIDAAAADAKLVWDVFGLRVAPVREGISDARFRAALQVREVRGSSPAADAGIQVGDLLVGLHEYQMQTLENLAFVADRSNPAVDGEVKAYVLRGGTVITLTLRMPAHLPAR